jgi:hypothetical protein
LLLKYPQITAHYILLCVLIIAIWRCADAATAALRFEKVSDHCYSLPMKDGANVGVVVTDDGILMVNPPQEKNRASVAEALKKITSKPVRWIVFTDPRCSRAAGARAYAEQGAQLLGGVRFRALSAAAPAAPPAAALPAAAPPAAEAHLPDASAAKSETSSGNQQDLSSFPWLIFDRQLNLFLSNIEIRIFALQHNAHTGGDIVVHVPAEKVLFVGDLYEAACYPDIDADLRGSALGWIDGLKQVIESIPVLKPAIPQGKPEPKSKSKPEQEASLEEGITAVSARGAVSNLQNMKDLLEASQKLRNDISKAINARQSCERYLASPGSNPYRSYANFDRFAAQLFEALSAP